MATLGSPSPPGSPSLRGRRRPWARKCERYCCSVLSCFPLAFVYGLTSWAVWVEARIGFLPDEVPKVTWTGYTTSTLGIVLYLLLNWSYSVAVFTDPGSPLNTKDGYSHIPMEEGEQPYTSFTVKSTGDLRYCKKCQVKKPDRSHHCSTCRRCVLKMDHHCPWLATCVGLRNYKPFLLFLIYTSVFCWLSFAVSITWVWSEITNDEQLVQVLMPINFILLAVLSGIIGLVLTGFTLWHVYLAATGQTTIESLEKTRYLSPIRKSLQNHINGARNYVNGVPSPSYGQQLAEIHANALPGITRPEEGDATSPATASLRNNYNELQLARERDRYQDYLDEQASEKLPNAFDLGWRRNLMHVFGERRLLWLLPLCNTTGDGWTWEASKKWLLARERIAKERSHHESRSSQPDELDERAGFVNGSPGQHVRRGARRSRSSGQRHGMTDPARSGSPREIRAVDGWDGRAHGPPNELSNWNDIPEDMLNSRRGK